MKTLRETLEEAQAKNAAIGHFNISNIEMFWGVVNAARNLNLPVIIGLSEGERDFFGFRQGQALVESIRAQFDHPLFINADHTYSVSKVAEAVDAGADSAIFDGAKLPMEENIKRTKECVLYSQRKGTALIEGELGYIGTSSKILDELPEGVGVSEDSITSVEDAVRFVGETGVHCFAPAVGNVHGMFRNAKEPRLHIGRIKAIKDAVKIPLVLHGASGNSAEDIRAAIAAGISIVHVSTEIRFAYSNALKAAVAATPDEIAPYKLMQPVVDAVTKIVEEKLRIIGGGW